jgi:hypothetical protein
MYFANRHSPQRPDWLAGRKYKYEATCPRYAGLCYCTDCQKASGSGFIPFMGFVSSAVRFNGRTLQYTTKAANGGDAVSNSSPVCGSLVFGGVVGKDSSFTIYAGTLDDSSSFHPTAAKGSAWDLVRQS